jgi:trehalose 6-phosphate synthase/phosphatase
VVEVRIAGVNKGTVADDIIRAAEHDAPIDFILCIGDDEEDEYMLSATTARASSPEMRDRLRDRLFTVTIGVLPAARAPPPATPRCLTTTPRSPPGSKPASHAQFLAENSRDVLQLLEIVRQDKSSRGV